MPNSRSRKFPRSTIATHAELTATPASALEHLDVTTAASLDALARVLGRLILVALAVYGLIHFIFRLVVK